MKISLKFFILFIVLGSGTWMLPEKATAQTSVSFQVFYDDLSPYGNWVDYPNYGYVWVPNAGADFSPYRSNGHWVYTDYGWTWVSNYSWGWAPFHYGRWHYDPYYGNVWIPGNEWGPGWVSWRQSEGYYGWAPIEPGISIDVAYSSGYSVPNDRWVFVGSRDFGRTNMDNYYVSRTSNTTIINNTTVINNVQSDRTTSARYNAGPDRAQVQSRTGNAIAPVAVKERNNPGESLSNGELQTYRPRVEKGNAKPSKLADIKDVKPAGRSGEAQPQKTSPAKQQPAQQQKSQPAQQQKSEPAQQHHQGQSSPQQHQSQPAQQQQPAQHQHKDQPAQQQQQPSQHQQKDQPAQQQQPPKQQHNTQQERQPPTQQEQPGHAPKDQQPQHQKQNAQPDRQQAPKEKGNDHQAAPQQPQQQADPHQNEKKEEKGPR